jgi:hypothetical protein
MQRCHGEEPSRCLPDWEALWRHAYRLLHFKYNAAAS